MKFYTPLRYPGGKGRLSGFMKSVFECNNLCDGTYIEPYAGGAAIALTLLLEEYAWKIVINDVDPLIYAFWHTMLEETEWFLKKISDTPVDMSTWYQCKSIHQHYQDYSLREVGFATFFMNRTNRSGIIKAGVIGGKKQSGPYLLDARFNKKNLSARIKKIALYRNRIKLTNLDAIELLEKPPIAADEKAFFYLDPPYYCKGSMLYSNFYTHEDHVSIAEHVKGLDVPWILTYDSVSEIHALYESEPRINFSLTYSANKERKKGEEVMYYGRVNIPSEYIQDEIIHFKRAS